MPVRRALVVACATAVTLAVPAIAGPPQSYPQAGPPVSYADQQHDAYRITLPDGSSRPALLADPQQSRPAYDVVAVDWAPVQPARKRDPGGYRTSITVLGEPSAAGSYVSYGRFTYDGEECMAYHFLTPGTDTYANVFCGFDPDGTRHFVGRIRGGPVTSSPGSTGTVLTAVFDNRVLPAELAAGRTLTDLSAFTCVSADEGRGCRPYEVLDAASSPGASYRI